jgi:hypothetical protein
VHAHAHADRRAAERLLTFTRRRKSVTRAREGDEERVALGVDLDAAVSLERGAERAPVLAQRLGVSVAELVEQLRRAFDVGEEEGDRAGGELADQAAGGSPSSSS